MPTQPGKDLITVANPKPTRKYRIHIVCPEFTCLCPMTGQPDFATISISYTPAALCLELKSIKLYLWSYRNEGAFHEAAVNAILDDLVAACRPYKMTVTGRFKVRGGLQTTVTARYICEDQAIARKPAAAAKPERFFDV